MSENRRRIGSDLAKVDAHVIQPEEYEDAPEATAEDFARADLYVGGVLVKRGRPKSATAKQLVSLRIDPDVLDHFKKRGAGWQTSINQALRKIAKLDRHAPARPAKRAALTASSKSKTAARSKRA